MHNKHPPTFLALRPACGGRVRLYITQIQFFSYSCTVPRVDNQASYAETFLSVRSEIGDWRLATERGPITLLFEGLKLPTYLGTQHRQFGTVTVPIGIGLSSRIIRCQTNYFAVSICREQDKWLRLLVCCGSSLLFWRGRVNWE